MARRRLVAIRHPKLGRTTRVSPRSVAAWGKRGWVRDDSTFVQLAHPAGAYRQAHEEAIESAQSAAERRRLAAEAEALGIQVDGRWGAKRLAAEIAALTADEPAPAGADTTPHQED